LRFLPGGDSGIAVGVKNPELASTLMKAVGIMETDGSDLAGTR